MAKQPSKPRAPPLASTRGASSPCGGDDSHPLQKQHAGHIEGLTRLDWGEDDYAIIDIETIVGRIYKDQILGK